MVFTTKNEILACLAYCAIRQSPYLFPDNLIGALTDVSKEIDNMELFESMDKKTYKSYRNFDDKELYGIIKDLVHNIPSVNRWNITKIELDKGITDPDDPNRSVKYVFTDRYTTVKEDFDFIDLDALARNIYNMIEPVREEERCIEAK